MSARSMPLTLLGTKAAARPGPRGGPSRVEVTAGRFADFRNEADQPSQGPALERRPGQARLEATGMPCCLARVADVWSASGFYGGRCRWNLTPGCSARSISERRLPNLIAIPRPAAQLRHG